MANVKKLSVATVYGRIDVKRVITSNEPIPVMDVIGVAVGSKSGEGQYGPWTALTGQFEATNPETGEVYQSSQLFLPEIALTPIMVALSQDGAKGVRFAIRVMVRASDNRKPGGVPYEYTFESLVPPAEDDPLQQLRAAVQAAALPAPQPVASPSDSKVKGKAGK